MLHLVVLRRALSAATIAMFAVFSPRAVLGPDPASIVAAATASVRRTVGPGEVPLGDALLEIAAVGRVRTDSTGLRRGEIDSFCRATKLN